MATGRGFAFRLSFPSSLPQLLLLVDHGLVGFGEDFDPDFAGNEDELFAPTVLVDGAIEAGLLAPGGRKDLAFAYNKGVAATGSTIEHMLFFINGAGLGDELDDNCFGFNLVIGISILVGLAAVDAFVNLGVGVESPGDVILGVVLPEVKVDGSRRFAGVAIRFFAELPGDEELGPGVALFVQVGNTTLLSRLVEVFGGTIHRVFSGNFVTDAGVVAPAFLDP